MLAARDTSKTTELRACRDRLCTRTGNLAQYSYRKSQNDNLVLLGETEEYEPLSRAAYYKATMREKIKNMKVNDAEQLDTKPETKNG